MYVWEQYTPYGIVTTADGKRGRRVRTDTGETENVVFVNGDWYRDPNDYQPDEEHHRVPRQIESGIMNIPPILPDPGPRQEYWNRGDWESEEDFQNRVRSERRDWLDRHRAYTVNQQMHRYVTWLNQYNEQHNTHHPLRWEHLYDTDEQLQTYYDELTAGVNQGPLAGVHPDASILGMAAKRPKIEAPGDEEEGHGSAGAAITTAHRLFRIHYYKSDYTIVRKQHLTIGQYKPGEATITQYYVTCLPIQLVEFWTENINGTRHRDPFNTIMGGFDYIAYNHAHVRLSHFVPLQNALQGSAQTDIPAFNTAPYAYVAQDNLGIIPKITATENITHATMVSQEIKLPSNAFWTNDNDEGLLGLDDVKTLGQNEFYDINLAFDNQFNRLKQRKPIWNANTLHYLPQAIVNPSTSVMATGLTYNYESMVTADDKSIIHAIPKRDIPFTFIFLPHIEKVSAGENATRLYAHLLMETSLNVTLWSIPDGSENLNFNKAKNLLNSITIGVDQKNLYSQAFQF